MAESKMQRLPLQSNSSPQRSIRLLRKSRRPPTPPSPTHTTATSMDLVGDEMIPALPAVSGLEDHNDPPQSPKPGPQRLPQYKVPEGFFLLFGKLHPLIPQSQTPPPPPPPTDATATSIVLLADQPIPAASAVNGQQDTDNPPQPPTLGPNAPVHLVKTLNPNGIGISENEKLKLWESYLWFPGVHIAGRSRKGFQIFLGYYLTKQEAQVVHDRAALKLFETEGVKSYLNFHASQHAEFMEEFKDWNFRDLVWQFRRYCVRFTTGQSSMKGVAVRLRAKRNLFEAKTAYTYSQEEGNSGKVMYNLGNFKSEEEAGRAYDRALLFLHRKETEEEKWHVITNFRPSRYSESEILRAGRVKKIRTPILPGLLE